MAKINKRALDKELDEQIAADPNASIVEMGRQGILNAIVQQNDVDGYTREIVRLWNEAKEKFLAIGNYLVLAKRMLPHGDYEEMVRSRLPFDPSVARKIRAVAEAVQNGVLSRERLPNSYATAYELTLLTEDEFRLAEARNLVRPDVYRREIQALRAEVRMPVDPQQRLALQREYQRIQRDMKRLRARADEIMAKLGGTVGELSTKDGQSEQVSPGPMLAER
jgi:hypothetical protein